MKRRALLGVLGTIGVTGCLRLTNDGGTAATSPVSTTGTVVDTSTPTQADASTPTQTETSTAEASSTSDDPSLPSGLTEDGVTAFLYPTHARTLRNTSFRARWTKLNQTNSEIQWQRTYLGDQDVAFGTWNRENGNAFEIYRDGRNNYWQEVLGDRATYGSDNGDRGAAIWGREVQPLLEAADWSPPERVNETRPARWTVTSNGAVTDPPVPGYNDQGELVSISSARMTVDERGIIRSIEAAYTIDRNQRELAFRSKYTIDSIGTISVREPDWLGTAREQAPVVEGTLTDDNQFVRMTIESGNRLEAGSVVFVNVGSGFHHFNGRLDAPVEPGEPVYLYKPGDAPDTGGVDAGISRGSPPTNASPATLDGSLSLGSRRWTTTYFRRVNVT